MREMRPQAAGQTVPIIETGHKERSQGKRFRILLATDGSEHAKRAANFLASLLTPRQAEVRLVTVVSREFYSYDLIWGDELSDAFERRAKVASAEAAAFRESGDALRATGQVVSTCHRFGHPADEIANEIAEWGPELVVVGRRGIGRPASWMLGSVSEYLVKHSKVPVLVVP